MREHNAEGKPVRRSETPPVTNGSGAPSAQTPPGSANGLKIGAILEAGWHGAVELLLFFPLALVAYLYIVPAGMTLGWWLVLLLACCPLGFAIGMLARRMPKVLGFAGTMLASAALAYLAAAAPAGAFGTASTLDNPAGLARAVAVWAIAWFLAARGGKHVRRRWPELFPTVCYAVGLISYFLVSVIARFAEAWKPYSSLLWWVGLAAVLASLFLSNRRHLQANAYTGDDSSELAASVRSQNTIWTVVVFVVVLIAAAFTRIKDALAAAFKSLVQFIFWFFSLFASDGQKAEQTPEPTPAPQQQLPPPGEPSRLAELLEKLFFALTYVLLAAAVLYGLYRLVKFALPLLRRWLHRLMEQWGLGRSADEARNGYVDEKQSLLDWAEVPAAWGKSLRDRLSALLAREPKWDDMRTNRERVRYLYRLTVLQAMKRGYDWEPGSTPAETMKQLGNRHNRIPGQGQDAAASGSPADPAASALSSAYEEARYGERDPSDDRTAKLRKDLLKE
ncbi:DUF4129 domain-containing protein [Paenibacillus sp. MBLB4367]|uniref:DUF4129 domain-containing protein n=1 Tax=Paenibacillus sp. MBLB4367 TaxID=3384767 RepID=UPI00390828E1